MSEKIIELGPHNKMTPQQALEFCAREEWHHVLIIGTKPGDPNIVIRSSQVSREFANWIVDHAKLIIMGAE